MFEGVTGAQWLDAGSKVLSAGLGGSGPAAPSRAESTAIANADFSGWTVATGKARADGATVSPWLVGAIILGLWIWKRAK